MPISIQQISYIHPDKEVLFSDLNFAISKGQKLGLVGNNGCGKSTLLQIIAGQLSPSSGVIVRPDDIYYIPQHFGQYDSLTIAQALRIDRKQQALQAILAGDASTENFNQLDDDWNIEERSVAALDSWGLGQFPRPTQCICLAAEKRPVFFWQVWIFIIPLSYSWTNRPIILIRRADNVCMTG